MFPSALFHMTMMMLLLLLVVFKPASQLKTKSLYDGKMEFMGFLRCIAIEKRRSM